MIHTKGGIPILCYLKKKILLKKIAMLKFESWYSLAAVFKAHKINELKKCGACRHASLFVCTHGLYALQ